MTNKVYFVADLTDDYAIVHRSFVDAQNELFSRGCEDELLFVADAVEVDVDAMDAATSAVLVDMGRSGAFVQVDSFDTFEDFEDEVAYHLNEAIDFYGLDAHAYALSNVERYQMVMTLARC